MYNIFNAIPLSNIEHRLDFRRSLESLQAVKSPVKWQESYRKTFSSLILHQ